MTIQVMNQIPRQKRQLLDVVIFAPLLIVVLTYLLPSNVFLSLISMFLICTFPGFAVIYRYKLHRSNHFQDLFLSVLLSLLLLQSVYASYSVLCYGLGFEQSITNTQVFILAIVILLFSAFSLRKNMDEHIGYELIFKISQRLNGRIFL
jgi:di/tricarboxylate transporter